jgi:hypothetical protein
MMHRYVRRLIERCQPLSRCCLSVTVAAMTVSAPSLAVAAPAAEYGPEAEAEFRVRCEATGTPSGQCQAMMEALQTRIGYAAFLDGIAADGAPAGRFAYIRIAPERAEAQP